MAILNYLIGQAGLDNVDPQVCFFNTNDTVALVTASGYLTSIAQQNPQLKDGALAAVLTKTSVSAANSNSGWYNVQNASGVWSLVPAVQPGGVALPTIANHLAVFLDTVGSIGEDAATAINGGNIQAGLSGTAGTLASFPATASKGALVIAGVANTGNTNVTISNAAHGQATVYSIADIGAATGGLMASTVPLKVKSVAAAAAAGGAAAQSFSDAFCTSGSVVIGNWVTQTTPVQVIKIVPGNGSFVVTSTGDAGVGTFSYIIQK